MRAPGKQKFSSGSQLIFCVIGGVVATYLLYEYILKGIAHPLFFWLRLASFSPFYLMSTLFPDLANHIASGLSNILGRDSLPSWSLYGIALFDPGFYKNLFEIQSYSGQYSFEEMVSVGGWYSRFSAFIMAPLFLFYISKVKNIRTFKTLYNQESLLKVNEKVFSSVAPIVNRNIAKEPLNSGPWALADTPLLFSLRNRLLVEEPKDGLARRGESLKEEDMVFFSLTDIYGGIPDDFESEQFINATLVPSDTSRYLRRNNLFRSDLAASIFIRQLGEKINGGNFIGALKKKSLDECGNCWRAVFAGLLYSFGASPESKVNVAYPLLDKFSRAFYAKGPMNLERLDFCTEVEVDRVWEGYEKNYDFVLSCLPYATFESTFFMHLLDYAKKKGKISPSDYLWLRPLDRTLYFSMDQVGSRVGIVEALGPYSHYTAERFNGSGLHYPYIKDAVEGCYASLSAEGWLPQRSLSYTQRTQLSVWDSEAALDKLNKTESIVSDISSEIETLQKKIESFSKVKHILEVAPALPPFLLLDDLSFFTEEEKEDFQQKAAVEAFRHLRKVQTKKKIFGTSGKCPVCSEPFSDGKDERSLVRAFPLFSLSIDKEGKGVWRFSGVSIMCNSCVTRRTVYKQSPSSLTSTIFSDQLETYYGIPREDSLEVFSLLGRLSDLYASLEWQYSPTSSVLADIQTFVKKINR